MRLNKSRLLLGRVCQMMFSNTVIEMSSSPDLTTVGVGKPRFGKVYLQTEIFGPSHGAFQQYEMKAGSAQAESCCVYVKSENMHGIIPQLFDCWADPVGHLLLLKSSIPNHNRCRFYCVGFFLFSATKWSNCISAADCNWCDCVLPE